MTLYLISVLAVSAVCTAVLGKTFIPVLMSKKIGQPVKEIGPRWHKCKDGTPTMGGLFFIAGTALSLVISFFFLGKEEILKLWICYGFTFLSGMVGIIDDSKKLFEHKNDGIRAYQKVLLQAVIASLFLLVFEKSFGLCKTLYIPFFGAELQIGFWFYIFFVAFFIFTSNSVNLTDGIDGLASSVTTAVCVFFTVKALLQGQRVGAVLAISVFGGCIGFLVYNAHPARVFMGDTGSLFLGGAVVTLSLLTEDPLILVIVGIVYFIEAFSVILQVGYFKISHGKRLFKMSPLHHHFELCGWSEGKIVLVAVSVTVIMSVISYFFE